MVTGAWDDPAVRAAVQLTITAGRVNLFPQLLCVGCEHDVEDHEHGMCWTVDCDCTREVFDDA